MGGVAAASLKPLRDSATVAVLDSEWFESLFADALNSEQIQAALKRALATEGAEHVLETLFGSGLVDEFLDRLATDAALWALIDKALAGDGADRLAAKLFDSGLADRLVERLRTSRAVWRLVDEIAGSPAVTSAVTQQSLGFVDQFGNEIRARSRKADDWLLETARRHRKMKEAPASVNRATAPPTQPGRRPLAVLSASIPTRTAAVRPDARYVGIVSRTLAFAVDAVLIGVVGLVVEVAAALIFSVVHLPSGLKSAMIAAGAALFAVWATSYFVAFWSTTGQTPGARIMQFRVLAMNGGELRPRRAVLRSVCLVLAALPLFAGYLPVAFARKRRGLHDYAARTIVVDAPQPSLAGQRRVAAPSQRAGNCDHS